MLTGEEILKRFYDWINSEQGKKSIEEYKRKQEFIDNLKEEKLSWFDSIGPDKRSHYIQKIIDKYESKEYQDRWYNRGIFPPEELYSWLYSYAYKYGKCWNATFAEAGPGFDSKFLFDNWVITCYLGQGTKYIVRPAGEEDFKKGPNKLAQELLGHEYGDYYETLTSEFE